MGKYILLAIALIVAFGPAFALRVHRAYSRSITLKEWASKPFVCPNCGHKFYTKQRIVHPLGENKGYLKCPNCGKRDICGRPYDFEDK